ncbi:MAG: MFS transporter, partial [Solirubrobacteraceae bacterium]
AGASQQLIRRIGLRNVSLAGTVLAAIGMVVLTQLPVDGSYVSDLLVGLIPLSIGMGLVFVPITLMGTSGVRDEDSGLASGLFNTAQQVGGSLGLAILSTLAASRTSSLLHGSGLLHPLQARVAGYHVAFLAAAIMLGTAAVILVVGLRRSHMREVERTLHPAADPAPSVA